MKGSFEHSDKNYEWWAGPADDDASVDYCVHCRHGEWGVTRYMDSSPSESEARRIARDLVPHIDRLQ